MITHFDHVAICVRDVNAAKRFFGLLGFEEDKATVISGEPMQTAVFASVQATVLMAQVHVLTGPERRRRYSEAEKRAIVASAFAAGVIVSDVARQADVCASLIYRWRRELAPGSGGFSGGFADAFLCLRSTKADRFFQEYMSMRMCTNGGAYAARIIDNRPYDAGWLAQAESGQQKRDLVAGQVFRIYVGPKPKSTVAIITSFYSIFVSQR